MGKAKRSDREYTREQRLVQENQRLKKELSRLRKQLARLDLDRYDQVREIIQEHYQNERKQEGEEMLERLKQTWACKVPGCEGFLEIVIYTKRSEPYYFRKCNASNCNNRTLPKKYTEDVKGIKKQEET